MAYVWSKELETGNSVIDNEHKELINAINNLLNACMSGKGKEALIPALDFMSSYTVKHFGAEEGLQRQHQYPDYPNHKKLHDYYVNLVKEFSVKMKAEGPTTALVAQVTSSVGDWLINHIQKEDTKLAAHIRSVAK